MGAKTKSASAQSFAIIGFEAKLWLAAGRLRSNMDAAEYKHVVLGLIFLKYISDTFEEHRAKLLAGQGDYVLANPPSTLPIGSARTTTRRSFSPDFLRISHHARAGQYTPHQSLRCPKK